LKENIVQPTGVDSHFNVNYDVPFHVSCGNVGTIVEEIVRIEMEK
jgi:hypothetical protein